MSLSAACAWSLLRSLLIALTAGFIAARLVRGVARRSGAARAAAWGLLVAPWLVPPLLVGYAYAGSGLRWASAGVWDVLPAGWGTVVARWLADHSSAVDELLLSLLLLARAVPVAALVMWCAPRPAYSEAAWHCRRLARRADESRWERWRESWNYAWYGAPRAAWGAVGVSFAFAFQEFELPSLLGRPAWTVWLFDAQAGGLPLADSLRAAALPALCQGAVIVPLWRALTRFGTGPAPRALGPVSEARGTLERWYLPAAVGLSCVVPLALIGGGTLEGLAALVRGRLQLERTLRETLAGTLLSLGAAVAAVLLVEWSQLRSKARPFVLLLALPGLFGSLVLGLSLVRVLQWGPVNPLYRTPASLWGATTLFLLPRALLIAAVIQAVRRHSARHAAILLTWSPDAGRRVAARELAWRLGNAGRFWSIALLTWWGFLELTLASLLGPVTMVSVPVLLYNQMHFGKNAMLSAMTTVAVALPAAAFVIAASLRTLMYRWFWR